MNASDSSAPVAPRGFLDQPTFDFVVFGKGLDEQRLSFDDFRALQLRQRVQLLLGKQPRFFLGEREISRVEAMRFQG